MIRMVGNPGLQILKVRDLVLRSEFSQTLEAAAVTDIKKLTTRARAT